MSKVQFYRPFLNSGYPAFRPTQKTYTPATNILKDDNGYTIEVDVAGYVKEEISLNLENGTLTIEGKFEKAENDTVKYVQRTFSKKPFSINFKLSDTIDSEQIIAKVENGLLNIHLGIKEESKKVIKNISIN